MKRLENEPTYGILSPMTSRSEQSSITSPRVLARRLAALARRMRARWEEAEWEAPEIHDLALAAMTREQTADVAAQLACFLPLIAPASAPEIADPALRAELSAILATADLPAVLEALRSTAHRADPLAHLYEWFLAAYDPAQRTVHGVFDTPAPVVAYLVRSADHLLRALGMPAGLAGATVLDPCTGTGAFLRGVLAEAPTITRLMGWELLPAPYAITRLRLADTTADVRLLNALEEAEFALSPDAAPLVVVGNPPYAGHSTNTGTWITNLLHAQEGFTGGSYFDIDGTPLQEANVKWLLDDYVKFLRLGQWLIARAGAGVMAVITNHGYLDTPTFRAMRHSLAETFSTIYILDLHGNKVRETHRADDENLFAIRQGVAIGLFVRQPGGHQAHYHAALRGTRDEKLAWLDAHTVADTPWQRVIPRAPAFLFVPRPRTTALQAGVPLPEFMPLHSLGILTKRDALVVGFTEDDVWERVSVFADPVLSDSECAARFRVPAFDRDRWQLARVRAMLHLNRTAIRPFLYRPLDQRWLYYDDLLVARPNHRVLDHLYPPNRALIVGRQGGATGSPVWDVAWVTTCLTDQNIFRRGGGAVFPLYRRQGDEWAPNLDLGHLARWQDNLGQPISPERFFHYCYALLQAPAYRERYAGELRGAFPIIPLLSEPTTFNALAMLGESLVTLHLGRTPLPVAAVLHGAGEGCITRVRYATGQVWINDTQAFVAVDDHAWTFTVGGYQLCRKWLLDRQGRTLSPHEQDDFGRLVACIGETQRLAREVDEGLAASFAL